MRFYRPAIRDHFSGEVEIERRRRNIMCSKRLPRNSDHFTFEKKKSLFNYPAFEARLLSPSSRVISRVIVPSCDQSAIPLRKKGGAYSHAIEKSPSQN
jgi:hypothetical protein